MTELETAMGFSPDFIPEKRPPFWKLQDLAYRNATAVTEAIRDKRFNPYNEYQRGREEFLPWKSTDEGFEDARPRIFLIARESQDDTYFVGKPFYPQWELTPDFLDRALRSQTYERGNRLGRLSYNRVHRMDGSAKDAEICGIVFTKFFEKARIKRAGYEGKNDDLSDWEIIAEYLNPAHPITEHQKPEIFTYRTLLEPALSNWPQINTKRDVRNLESEQKNQFAEDVIGQGLMGVARESSNQHIRQVAARLLELHPYDPTHKDDGGNDQISYHISESPEYALAENYLWSQELADQLIPDNSTPVYLPNYGRQDAQLRGTLYFRNEWLSKILEYHPVNALAEITYAASLARDDSFGRLRGVTMPPPLSGVNSLPKPIPAFPIAIERALIHTELFVREIQERDQKGHGIKVRLEGLARKAHDKYNRYANLERHPYLYNDPHERNRGHQRPDRGPDDDNMGSFPRISPNRHRSQ